MVDVKDIQTDLGPWKDADLAGTLRTTPPLGADSDLPHEVRFNAGVVRLIRRRLVVAGAETDPNRPAVFLLEPIAHWPNPDTTPTPAPMLDNGLTPVTGRLWFVSNPAVVAGKYVDLEDCDDDRLFRIVTEDLHFGNVPAVIFDPRLRIPEFRFYGRGLSRPEICEVVSLNAEDVSLARIFEIIDIIYLNSLVTPEVQGDRNVGGLWEENTKKWVSRHAESRVQYRLRLGLSAAFKTCIVRQEQTSVAGRLDLKIEEYDPIDRARNIRHAILELKVLRSFGSKGARVAQEAILKWIDKGVRQAAVYRDQWNAIASALCCFDMRLEDTGEASFEHVSQLAQRLEVELNRWFIFATSEEYREVLTTPH